MLRNVSSLCLHHLCAQSSTDGSSKGNRDNRTHQKVGQTKQLQEQKTKASYLNETTCGACMTRTPPNERGPQSKPQGGDLKACAGLGQNAPRSSSPRVCLACPAHEKRAVATLAEALRNKMHEQVRFRTRAKKLTRRPKPHKATTDGWTKKHIRHLRKVLHAAPKRQLGH